MIILLDISTAKNVSPSCQGILLPWETIILTLLKYQKLCSKKRRMIMLTMSRMSSYYVYQMLSPIPILHSIRMVKCIHCGREFHTICILHHPGIWSEGYQCDGCLKIKGTTRRENKFCAKRKLKILVISAI